MKSLFIAFDQAFTEKVIDILTVRNCRGFSMIEQLQGRGSKKGIPHYGTHTWPSMCSGIIAIVEDHVVDSVLDALHELDESKPKLGLRAFVWDIERMI